MGNKIYISAPIATDWSTVMRFQDKLKQKFTDVKVWDRESRYKQEDFDNAGHVVFILPDNKFKAEYHQLPVGLKAELSRAYATNKKVYVAYKSKDGYFIYDTRTNGKNIEGIGGTADRIFTDLTSDPRKGTKKETSIEADDILDDDFWGMAYEAASNLCVEIPLPNSKAECVLPVAKKIYATTVLNPDYIEADERLLLMM